MTLPQQGTLLLHANCVVYDGRGVLVVGPSGSGKSALSLQLIALGAKLVSDDRTILQSRNGTLVASCPSAISGMIEAYGVGILRTEPESEAVIRLVIDLGQAETRRLPPRRSVTFLNIAIELVHGSNGTHFSSAVLCYLLGGRQE